MGRGRGRGRGIERDNPNSLGGANVASCSENNHEKSYDAPRDGDIGKCKFLAEPEKFSDAPAAVKMGNYIHVAEDTNIKVILS